MSDTTVICWRCRRQFSGHACEWCHREVPEEVPKVTELQSVKEKREEIIAILIDWIEPSELGWMVESCPSIEDARAEVRRRKGDPDWRRVRR